MNLLSNVQQDQILEYSIKTIIETGLGTSKQKLLKLAEEKGFKVIGNRIYPEKQQILEALDHVQSNRLPPDHSMAKHHTFLNSVVTTIGKRELAIRINDRATCISDNKTNTFRPLSRKDVIDGTKLIHQLHQKYGVAGFACGTPQETHTLLNGIEQYLIGFRYNKLGGNTEVPLNSWLLDHYFEIREIAEDGFNRHNLDTCVWSPSPMFLDSDEIDFFFADDTKISNALVGSMPIMGLSGPTDQVGNVTLALAEVLGGTAILHFLFPETKFFMILHPQAMDLNSGLLSFGSIDHIRMELVKTEVIQALGLPYASVKDTLTSSQMPGLLAQAEKMMNIVSSMTHGATAFNICPVSCDEGWSSYQTMIEVEYIRNVWSLLSPVQAENRAESAYKNIKQAVDENQIFGGMEDTVMNMFNYYQTDSLFTRTFGYQKWNESGCPDPMQKIQPTIDDLISAWNYEPDSNKWADIIKVYNRICDRFGVKPAVFS